MKNELLTLLILFPFYGFSLEKPNIIIFLVDDMGITDMSVPVFANANQEIVPRELNKFYRTPNLEFLAKKGIRFSQFHAHSVCSPSRISLLTGQNSARHKTTTWIKPTMKNTGQYGPKRWNWMGLGKNSVTLPRILQSAGYRTIHIGKGHFGPQNSEGSDPKNLGFTINIGGSCWGHPRSYLSKKHYGNLKNKEGLFAVPHLDKYYDTGTFLTEALTTEACNQIEISLAEEKPFFLYLSHYAVHGPFNIDDRFINNYNQSNKSEKAKAFATLIEGIDKSLGDIINTLVKCGIADNTLIFFLGDNGTDAPLGKTHSIACASPLRGKKGTHYEGGTRVPFFASWASISQSNPWQKEFPIAENKIQDQVSTIIDIYPTILDLLAIDSPKNHIIDGNSLRFKLNGVADSSDQQTFLMHFPHEHRSSYFTSFRKENWKLIYHYNPEEPDNPDLELFDLEKDPSESHNQAFTEPSQLVSMIKTMIEQLEKKVALYPEDVQGNPIKPFIPKTYLKD